MHSCVHGLEWCGECYSCARGRRLCSRCWRAARAARWRITRVAKYLKRPDAPGEGVPACCLDHAAKLSSSYPALWEFITLTQWEDGTARQPGSVTVFLGHVQLQACITCKESSRVAFVSGRSLEELLLALDQGLADDRLDWRRQRENGGGRVRGRA